MAETPLLLVGGSVHESPVRRYQRRTRQTLGTKLLIVRNILYRYAGVPRMFCGMINQVNFRTDGAPK